MLAANSFPSSPASEEVIKMLALQVNTPWKLALPSPFLQASRRRTDVQQKKEQSVKYTVNHKYLKPGILNPYIRKIKLGELFLT